MTRALSRALTAGRGFAADRGVRLASLGSIGVFLLALVVMPPATTRHIGLASSTPAKDSHVMKAPTELRLTFTGAINVKTASVELVGADNTLMALDTLRAVPDSARVAVAKITKPLPGGTYTVRWKAIAADGAAGAGSFSFMYMASEPKQ